MVHGRVPRPKRFLADGQPNPDFREEDQHLRDKRVGVIRRYIAGATVAMDADTRDALFLKRNSGWKPEDLGYPPRDYILIDLMRELG